MINSHETQFLMNSLRKACQIGTVLGIVSVFFASGCSSTNNLTLQGKVTDLQNQQIAVQNERDAWKNRYEELANSNRVQVHAIAASRHQIQTLQAEQLVLQKQLKDTLEQVANTQKQNEYLSNQLAKYEDIRRSQEQGTTFLSNKSENKGTELSVPSPIAGVGGTQDAYLPSIPGTVVSTHGNKIHIELPGNTLFESSGSLSPSGQNLIRQVAKVVSQRYPNAMIDIQGHVSTYQKVSAGFKDPKQQTMSQAMMVRDVMVNEHFFGDESLNVSAHGTNSPIISSGTEKGAQRNYRVELVITPNSGE
ncbi:MAG: hypothetical protein Q4C70_00935 [Planctomycetia bacterium]|nr:hypothetical protein [Planctomycetia bacterium]